MCERTQVEEMSKNQESVGSGALVGVRWLGPSSSHHTEHSPRTEQSLYYKRMHFQPWQAYKHIHHNLTSPKNGIQRAPSTFIPCVA